MKSSLVRAVQNVAVGLASSVTPIARRVEEAKTGVVEERHPLHESIQLLNAMRASGGIRRVSKGCGDNGLVEGQTPDKILRHVDFNTLHESIVTGEDRKESGPGWSGYGPIIESGERPQYAIEEVRRAAQNVNTGGNGSIPSLQEELFGS